MYFLSPMCAVCLQFTRRLYPIEQKSIAVQWLTQCVPEVDWQCLPRFYMCTSCQQKLYQFFTFRESCLKSIKKINWYLNKLKEEGDGERKDMRILLNKMNVPKELIENLKKSSYEKHNVIPSSNGAVVSSDNGNLKRVSFYTVGPSTTNNEEVHHSSVNTNSNFVKSSTKKFITPSTLLNKLPNGNPRNKMSVEIYLHKRKLNQSHSSNLNHTPNNNPMTFPKIKPMVILPRSRNYKTKILSKINPIQFHKTKPTSPLNSNSTQHSEYKEEVTAFLNIANTKEMSVPVDPMDFSTISDDEANKEINSTGELNDNNSEQVNPKYSCNSCSGVFNEAIHLNFHKRYCFQKYKKGVKRAVCPKCDKRFCTPYHLQKHLTCCKLNRKGKKIDQRNTRSKIKAAFLKKQESTSKLKCNYCQRSYDCLEYLMQHLSSVHKDIIHFGCQFCGENFTNSMLLEEHLPGHYNYFKCSSCKGEFTYVNKIFEHIVSLEHKEVEPVICVSCDMDFVNYDLIKEHSKLHLEDLVYECLACIEKFREIEELRNHIPEHFHDVTCLDCGKICKSSFELVEHMKVCEKSLDV